MLDAQVSPIESEINLDHVLPKFGAAPPETTKSDSNCRVFICTEDPDAAPFQRGASQNGDQRTDDPVYDPFATAQSISDFCTKARDRIVVGPEKFARWAGLALMSASSSIVLATAGLVWGPEDMPQWWHVVPAALPALFSMSYLVSEWRQREALFAAHQEKYKTYYDLSANQQHAAKRFRSHNVRQGKAALFEEALHLQSYLVLNERLHDEAREVELHWEKSKRWSWLIAAIAPAVVFLSGSAAMFSALDLPAFVVATLFLLLILTAAAGRKSIRNIVDFVRSPPSIDADEIDPFADIADWYGTILTQLNEYQAAMRGPYGRSR
jgi:hypothetical protein